MKAGSKFARPFADWRSEHVADAAAYILLALFHPGGEAIAKQIIEKFSNRLPRGRGRINHPVRVTEVQIAAALRAAPRTKGQASRLLQRAIEAYQAATTSPGLIGRAMAIAEAKTLLHQLLAGVARPIVALRRGPKASAGKIRLTVEDVERRKEAMAAGCTRRITYKLVLEQIYDEAMDRRGLSKSRNRSKQIKALQDLLSRQRRSFKSAETLDS